VAISSVDDIIAGAKPAVAFHKAAFTGEAVGEKFCALFTAGLPGAGAAPGNSINGTALTTLTGSIPIPSAVSGDYVELVGFDVTQAASVGGVWLVDFLWWNDTIAETTTTGQNITHPGLPARDRSASSNGDGVFAAILVSTATTNGSPVTNTTITYCVDPSTECLTRRGWARYDQLGLDDQLLAFDPTTKTTRWERPREVFIQPNYRGDMVLLSSGGWSALTTPDHRWPVLDRHGRNGRQRGDVFVSTTEALPRDHYALLRGAPHEAPEVATYSDAFVRLIAWYVTEGSLIAGGKSVTFCQSQSANPVHVEDIRRDVKEIGARAWSERTCAVDDCVDAPAAREMCKRHYHHWWTHETKRDGLLGKTPGRARRRGLWVNEYLRRGDIVTWHLTGDGVDQLIECAPGKDKVPTMEFLCSLTREQLRMFVDTCIAGDGTPEKRRFYQHHVGRMDAFTVAAALAGHGPTVESSGTTCSLGVDRINLEKVKRQPMHYEGTVWCPVTESGHWVARRNGKVFITGNTDQSGNSGNTGTITSFPATAVAGTFVPFNLAAGDTGVRSIQTLTLGTSYGGGTIHLVQYRPIAYVPLSAANIGASMAPGAQRIWDSSCLTLVYELTGTSGGIVAGTLRYSQG
jgi:hypothetical protein